MQSEPFHPEVATDAAVIHPVTPEALDEAAHKAAQMVDDVAHEASHAAPRHPAAGEASQAHRAPDQEVADTAHGSASEAAEGARSLSDSVAETARDGLAGARQAATEAFEVTGTAVQQSGDLQAKAAEAAGDAMSMSTGATAGLATAGLASGAGDAIGRYNAAVFGMIQTNMAATGEFFAALVKAQSVPEAVAINADHLRRQFDALTTQGRELAQLTQALALETLRLPAGTTRHDA